MGLETLEISKSFLPRRGDQATMATIKSNIVLAKGEFFLEYPNTGPGTKGIYRVKIGDGKTIYKDLPYALGDSSNNTLVITDEQLGDIDFDGMMDSIQNGTEISVIINALKTLIMDLNKRHNKHAEDNERHLTEEQKEIWDNVAETEAIQSSDLNTLTKIGRHYYADAGNSCAHKPKEVDAFGLFVSQGGKTKIIQVLIESNINPGRKWIRIYSNSTWSSWTQEYSSEYRQLTVKNDILDQPITETYIKSVTDTPSNKDVELDTVRNAAVDASAKDIKKVHSHKLEFFTGNNEKVKDATIEFDEANTQYQLHTNSKNGNIVKDEISLQLTSTDNTANVIKLKGDKDVKISAKNDEITFSVESTEYRISLEYSTSEIYIDPEPEYDEETGEEIESDQESIVQTIVDGVTVNLIDNEDNIITHFTMIAGSDIQLDIGDDNSFIIRSSGEIDMDRIPVLSPDKIPDHKFYIETNEAGDTMIINLIDNYGIKRDSFSLKAGYDVKLSIKGNEIEIASDDKIYQQSTKYTDNAIAALINGADETLDTLGEIADAMKKNQDVVTALQEAIGNKADDKEMQDMLETKLDKNANAASATKLVNARTIDGVLFDGTGNMHHYGTCGTGAGTTAKTVTIDGQFQLAAGAVVYVKMTNTNTVSSPTLNVNDTGAKTIRRFGSTNVSNTVATSWKAGQIVQFIYDGSYWYITNWKEESSIPIANANTKTLGGIIPDNKTTFVDNTGILTSVGGVDITYDEAIEILKYVYSGSDDTDDEDVFDCYVSNDGFASVNMTKYYESDLSNGVQIKLKMNKDVTEQIERIGISFSYPGGGSDVIASEYYITNNTPNCKAGTIFVFQVSRSNLTFIKSIVPGPGKDTPFLQAVRDWVNQNGGGGGGGSSSMAKIPVNPSTEPTEVGSIWITV